MDGSQRINPFLVGNYAPIRTEDDFELEIIGEIPREMNGAYYRNGANPQFEPRDDNHHWFAGDGMIHAVFVENGKARYRNRYVRTPKWTIENAAGRALYGTFGNPMTSDPSVMGKDGGVANTNIVWHGGRLLALEEGHAPFLMDPKTLESLGYAEEYGGPVTAHPKLDPETGEMVWFAYMAAGPFSQQLAYGVTDASGKVLRRDVFDAPYCSMVHDFLVTSGHVLFPVLPLTGSLERAMRGLPPFAWEPDKGSYVGVMARNGDVSSIRWFETDPLYVFHPMNAYEADGKIYADVMEYPVAPLFPNPDGSPGAPTSAHLVRWTFDLNDTSNRIRRDRIDDATGEFPRLDERFAGLDYGHGWFPGGLVSKGGAREDVLAHVNVKTGSRSVFAFDRGDSIGEPIFVPKSADAAEGDGWLVSFIYRGEEDRSEFAVFDAQNVAAGPIGRARLPRRVPFGFHGNWRPA